MPLQVQKAHPKFTFKLNDYPTLTKRFPLNNMTSVMEGDRATYIQNYDCPHSLAIWYGWSCSFLPGKGSVYVKTCPLIVKSLVCPGHMNVLADRGVIVLCILIPDAIATWKYKPPYAPLAFT
jgi:hypothetical protein